MTRQQTPLPWKNMANWIIGPDGADIAAVHGVDIKQSVENALVIVQAVNGFAETMTLLRMMTARLEGMEPHLSHWDEQWLRRAKAVINDVDGGN